MSSSYFTRVTGLLALLGAVALARDVRAQAGDLDILSRTVPPVVMIQMDTSSSMRQMVLDSKYRTDRGTANPNPATWFNRPSTDLTNRPAAWVHTATTPAAQNWENGTSTTENFERTCQIMPNGTTVASQDAVCAPGSTTCANDDDVPSQMRGNTGTSAPVIRCWNVPNGCTRVPAPLTCTTTNRARRLEGGAAGSGTSTPYTIITIPDVSWTSLSLWAPNYLWWMLNELYNSRSMPDFPVQDRLAAAKQAIHELVDETNDDPNRPRVKFGLSRYNFTPLGSADDNGGYVVVPAALNNKVTLLPTLDGLHAGNSTDTDYAGTPLSEALVDTARYLAGQDRLGAYPKYQYNTDGSVGDPNSATTTVPQSPLTSSCEKAFIVVVTDGIPTGDTHNSYTCTTPTVSPSTSSCFTRTFGPYPPPGFNDSDSDTNNDRWLNDVAAYLYAKDIRPTLSGNQNVITYTVGFSLDSTILSDGAAAGHGQYISTNDATELKNSLVTAINDIIARNTTLTSATVPATRTAFGNGFYTAYFTPTGNKTVWPGYLQAYTLDDTLVVRDRLNAPAIDPVTKLFYEPRKPHWDVSTQLSLQYLTRRTYTTKAGNRVDFSASNFFDPNDPNGASVTTKLVPADLGLTVADQANYPQPATHVSITDPSNPAWLERLGDSIIDFTRGVDSFDDDGDNNRTEVRPFVFGDVFHSSPVAVGPPLPFLRFETAYGPATDSTSFMSRYGQRRRVLYVGANDGMLHGFDAGYFVDPNAPGGGDEYYTPGLGDELFGYVPGMLLNKVKDLPRDSIGAKRYFVDGAPIAADAWLDYNDDGVKTGDEWTTVILAPMREGGESLLALDITDPNATTGSHYPYPRLIWEFAHAGLGQTWSRPIVTRVKMRGPTGTGDRCGANDGDGDCKEQWVAIFGAGYVHEANPNMGAYISDPNAPTFQKSRGVYMVDIESGAIVAQLKPAPGGSPATNPLTRMKYAIAAEPSVLDMDTDGFADVVYVGDLGGQMWKWDISNVGIPSAGPGPVPTSVWPAATLFEAPVVTVAAGRQHYLSIFQGAAAALSKGVLTLSFASGERADLGYMGDPNATDPNNPMGLYDDNNRFWVVKDKVPTGAGAFPTNLPIHETVVSGSDKLTDITSTAFDNDPNDAGYFFKVPEGMKFMTDHIIFGGVVVTLAYLPDLTGSGASGSCALGGTTFQFAWKLDNGVGVLTASGGAPSPTNPAIRGKAIGNGAPTNPRLTISKTSTGDIMVNATVQTSSGEVQHPEGLPAGFDPVQQVFWRQDF